MADLLVRRTLAKRLDIMLYGVDCRIRFMRYVVIRVIVGLVLCRELAQMR